jgi:peptide chain release factor 2
MPAARENVDVVIRPDEIKEDFYHASGHGGQNVQKVSTAVRITHVPSGIVVTCQSERSQFQNREIAMRILRARLMERELERQAEEQAKLKGERVSAGWSNQIRSYVLHPYQMVKDHRTEHETSNTQGVLDGAIDAFIKAYLVASVGKG